MLIFLRIQPTTDSMAHPRILMQQARGAREPGSQRSFQVPRMLRVLARGAGSKTGPLRKAASVGMDQRWLSRKSFAKQGYIERG